ncbi:MAG TPA: hypothetical protein VGZ28_07165 [Terriglobales bacterium]|nr:hypothetical protein [Terriglobales bacterium]
MRRRDYQNLFRREPPWSWQAAMHRVWVALAIVAAIMLAFWLVFWIGAHV